MVWALKAVDPALAPSAYYLKSASTYSVGRKDCYITIQTDKTISRLHANLISEEAKAPKSNINDVADIPRMSLRVHDLSKFGTFVNKQPGSKPLTSLPGSEASLNDGDVVTFGTNKTSFRVEFVPFFLCISASNVGKKNPTSKFALRHGAFAVETWKEGCTHVLVDEGSAVTEMVIAAVASRKPVLQINWWQKFSLETEVVTELLPYSSYIPTLVFQGAATSTPIKIALPELRKTILQDHSFLLVPVEMYQHGNHLVRLLEAAGGTVEFLSKTASSIPAAGTKQQFLVKPKDGTMKEAWASPAILNKVRHLSRTSEDKLVLAVLAGHVDVTSLPLPPSPVASADSDETREESDGNEDQDTAGSLSFKASVATPPASPPKAGTSLVGASAHIPIDLDESPVAEIKRTSKRSRQHETLSAEPGGNTELIGGNTELIYDNNAKRQKVIREERVTETPALVDYQDVKSILQTKEPIKATGIVISEPPEPKTRGRKRASMTIDKFFSQPEGSRAKKLQLDPEVSDTKAGKGSASQDHEHPYVVPSTMDIRTKTEPKGEALRTELPRVVANSNEAVEADVVYSQLVVRKDPGMVPFPTTPNQGSVPNFKRFRKKGLGIGVSGNAFSSLVPFAKEPYRESDLGRERNEFMQEERRRNEAERIAEDLFHNEKVKFRCLRHSKEEYFNMTGGF
ncbi:hypothetical protein M758_4G179300 [Ceratodon purpureus]|nr:hypothetical protein M758_4G179300 [Ceratodon purpureus]